MPKVLPDSYNAENETEGSVGEESLVESIHSQLIYLVKYGTSEKVQLAAISIALQFIRDLNLESGVDDFNYDDDEDLLYK